MWQLHLGALTLRLGPAVVSDLLGLLGQAVAEHAARRVRSTRESGLSDLREPSADSEPAFKEKAR